MLETVPDLAEPVQPSVAPPMQSALHDPHSGLHVEAGRLTGLVSADPDETATIAMRLGRLVELATSPGEAENNAAVTLGGTRLRDLPLGLVRERVLVSEAEPRLFTGRLRDELDPWGRTRDDDAALLAGVGMAAAHDVLDALPDGLDAEVEEAGRGFSGGQRQRLALARAVLADSDVLVLIEPTSAVDAHTEIQVARRLRAARHGDDRATADGRTTVVTTASPLLLDACDRVAFLVGGRVVATGTHRELLARHPDYRDTVIRGEDA